MLHEYLKTLQGLVRDRTQTNLNPEDLVSYVNRARREIALRTQCIRILPPVAGQIASITVLTPGSGYSNPSVQISPPDAPSGAAPNPGGVQATATAIAVSGGISDVSMTFGGDGYFQPTATIADPTGSGAQLAPVVTPISTTQQNQEIYSFSAIPLQQYPGVRSVYWVNSITIIFSNFRYSLPCYPFSVYQALIRQYSRQYSYVPGLAGQFGQGSNGSLYLYPIASQQYQLELDCFCLPTDLTADGEFEALAQPWTDAVPIGAAVYAYEELQNLNASTYYQRKFDEYVHRYSAWARPGRVTNPYGRW